MYKRSSVKRVGNTREIETKPKNKYGAKKTVIDGITFDSKAEGAFYLHLKALQKAKEITDFDMQVTFVLQEGYRLEGERKQIAITYTADFVVIYPDGSKKVIDVKGHRTQIFNIKKKLFEKKYNQKLWLATRSGRGFKVE